MRNICVQSLSLHPGPGTRAPRVFFRPGLHGATLVILQLSDLRASRGHSIKYPHARRLLLNERMCSVRSAELGDLLSHLVR